MLSMRERREWERICAHYSDGDPAVQTRGGGRVLRCAAGVRNAARGVRRQFPYLFLALLGCVISVLCAQQNLDFPGVGIAGMLLVLASYCLWRRHGARGDCGRDG